MTFSDAEMGRADPQTNKQTQMKAKTNRPVRPRNTQDGHTQTHKRVARRGHTAQLGTETLRGRSVDGWLAMHSTVLLLLLLLLLLHLILIGRQNANECCDEAPLAPLPPVFAHQYTRQHPNHSSDFPASMDPQRPPNPRRLNAQPQ